VSKAKEEGAKSMAAVNTAAMGRAEMNMGGILL
jgi:hypothetical protein